MWAFMCGSLGKKRKILSGRHKPPDDVFELKNTETEIHLKNIQNSHRQFISIRILIHLG